MTRGLPSALGRDVTVERLLVQLTSLRIRIAKGQLIALLRAHKKDAFHAEQDALLEAAGLATAGRGTPGATSKHTTQIGDDRCAWFATRRSQSRLNLLDELLRAGHPDDVLNAAAAAAAGMLEHGVAETVVTATRLTPERASQLPREAAWHAQLVEAFRLDAWQRRLVTEAAVVGAIVASRVACSPTP